MVGSEFSHGYRSRLNGVAALTNGWVDGRRSRSGRGGKRYPRLQRLLGLKSVTGSAAGAPNEQDNRGGKAEGWTRSGRAGLMVSEFSHGCRSRLNGAAALCETMAGSHQ